MERISEHCICQNKQTNKTKHGPQQKKVFKKILKSGQRIRIDIFPKKIFT